MIESAETKDCMSLQKKFSLLIIECLNYAWIFFSLPVYSCLFLPVDTETYRFLPPMMYMPEVVMRLIRMPLRV